MKFLSWFCFCLSPVVLFCSADGNGLILCPICIILGFVFKWIGNKTEKISYTDSEGKKVSYKLKSEPNGDLKVIFKVEPHKLWEWHYKDRIMIALAKKDSISDELMALKDKEARSWATTVCSHRNVWVPPEATQEQIARSVGVVTDQMVKERAVNKDRIQIGKYFLLKELEEKYYGKRFGNNERGERCYFPWIRIKDARYKIRLSNGSTINEKLVEYDYKMSIKEIWDNLSEQEKFQTTKWVKEYEEKLLKLVNIYIEKGQDFCDVDIDY